MTRERVSAVVAGMMTLVAVSDGGDGELAIVYIVSLSSIELPLPRSRSPASH